MNKKITAILFFIILTLAVVLRVYKISQIPPGVNQDEASIGYTAYSLLKTGMDEYKHPFPISFQSFGDWKLPFYIYETVFSVWAFGLSEFAVRLPSAVAGIATVALTYFLVMQLAANKKLAILAMFLVAVSPWHVHLSRVESESNTAVFFVVLAVILFFKSLKSISWLIVVSLTFFALTYFIYAGNHIFTTLLLTGIAYLYYGKIPKGKWTFLGIILFGVLFSYIAYHTLLGADKTKISGIGIFGDPSVVHAKIELPRNQHDNPQTLFTRLIHNRPLFAVEKFLQNYLNAFSPQFLYIKGGDNRAHNIANFGNMYIVESIFFYFGMFFLIFRKNKSKEDRLVLWWLLISPMAASITKDAPHSNRMFAIFPILPLITAIGIYHLYSMLNVCKNYKRVIIGVFVLLFTFNIAVYLDRYFIHFPKNEGERWGIGYKALSTLLDSQEFASKKIIMSKPHYSPYIYLLFYQKYDPKVYQETATRYDPTSDGFVHVRSFGRYEFRAINWTVDLKSNNNTVIVEDPSNVPLFVKNGDYSIANIYLPNGEIMFNVITNK